MQSSAKDNAPSPLKIFLVEDNPADIVLFKHILRGSGLSHSLTISSDGIDALEQLKKPGIGQPRYRPDVIFLDLNLPGKTGVQILAEIKADPGLACIPVAVLTASDYPEDRETCFSLGANAFLNKAVVFEDVSALPNDIKRFLLDPGPLLAYSVPDYPGISAA